MPRSSRLVTLWQAVIAVLPWLMLFIWLLPVVVLPADCPLGTCILINVVGSALTALVSGLRMKLLMPASVPAAMLRRCRTVSGVMSSTRTAASVACVGSACKGQI